MTTFTVTGIRSGEPLSLTWTDGEFDDPFGRTEILISTKQQVCATVMGPCYAAAKMPATVALLTAVAAMDEVTAIEGAEDVLAELAALSAVPDGAVS